MTPPPTAPHIRPRKRASSAPSSSSQSRLPRGSAASGGSSSSADPDPAPPVVAALPEEQGRVERPGGGGPSVAMIAAAVLPKGILRHRPKDAPSSEATRSGSRAKALQEVEEEVKHTRPPSTVPSWRPAESAENAASPSPTTFSAAATTTAAGAVKGAIVERVRPPRRSGGKAGPGAAAVAAAPALPGGAGATAVEGYVPRAGSSTAAAAPKAHVDPPQPPSPSDGEAPPPLVFDSLADLMGRAGTLPPSPPRDGGIPPGSLVEADLSFQVVDPDTFWANRQQQHRGDGSGGEDSDGSDEVNDDYLEEGDSDDEEGDDAYDPVDTEEFWQSLREHRTAEDYYSDDDDGDDKYEHGGIGGADRVRAGDVSRRPFLVLWRALSQWATPEAVLYLRDDSGEKEAAASFRPPPSDLEAARCAGLSTTLHLHLSSALSGLRCEENPRWARIRLAGLLRCLDYSHQAPSLDAAHLRALACVLLHAALRGQEGFDCVDDDRSNVPEPCTALGLSPPEYLCLTRAFENFGLPYDQEKAGDVDRTEGETLEGHLPSGAANRPEAVVLPARIGAS